MNKELLKALIEDAKVAARDENMEDVRQIIKKIDEVIND